MLNKRAITLPKLIQLAESLGAKAIGDACSGIELLAPDGKHWSANTCHSLWFIPQFTSWQPDERKMALLSLYEDLQHGLESCSKSSCDHLDSEK